MWKIRKLGYFVGSEWAIADTDLVVANGDLLSIVGWVVVKSTAGVDIAGISVWDKTFWTGEVINFPTKNEEMRVELNTTTDLAQANIGGSFDIDASQDVVLTIAWTQVQLVEILDTRKGSFRIL